MSGGDLALRLRERLTAIQGRPVAAPRPASVASTPRVELAGGREEPTPFGPCYLIERRYPFDHQHGPHPLGALREVTTELLVRLGGAPQAAAPTPDHLLFLDTETTGLAGGTGTYVFLVGLGYVTRASGTDEFVVRQYFLRDPREERAFLHALGALLDEFTTLVTFNGKSFDWPLLATRFTLQRLPHGRRAWPHLDLLHPARRIWKHRLESCSLGSLEAAVLGVRRALDVPGFLIPELYFRYLRDGDHHPLVPILAHNETDVMTLLALLVHLAYLVGAPAHPALPGADSYGLAGLHATLGDPERSIAAYQAALADPRLPGYLQRAARSALARALKRQRRWDDAVRVWRQGIEVEARRANPDPWAYEELAKYQEHVQRDSAAALATTEAALALLDLRGVMLNRAALLHRRARLQRKCQYGRPGGVAVVSPG